MALSPLLYSVLPTFLDYNSSDEKNQPESFAYEFLCVLSIIYISLFNTFFHSFLYLNGQSNRDEQTKYAPETIKYCSIKNHGASVVVFLPFKDNIELGSVKYSVKKMLNLFLNTAEIEAHSNCSCTQSRLQERVPWLEWHVYWVFDNLIKFKSECWLKSYAQFSNRLEIITSGLCIHRDYIFVSVHLASDETSTHLHFLFIFAFIKTKQWALFFYMRTISLLNSEATEENKTTKNSIEWISFRIEEYLHVPVFTE